MPCHIGQIVLRKLSTVLETDSAAMKSAAKPGMTRAAAYLCAIRMELCATTKFNFRIDLRISLELAP